MELSLTESICTITLDNMIYFRFRNKITMKSWVWGKSDCPAILLDSVLFATMHAISLILKCAQSDRPILMSFIAVSNQKNG